MQGWQRGARNSIGHVCSQIGIQHRGTHNAHDWIKLLSRDIGDFKNVEIFIYECLKEYGLEKFLIKHGGNEMNYDFGEINWNTVTSISNLSEKYQGAITKILPMYQKINDAEESKDSNIILSRRQVGW